MFWSNQIYIMNSRLVLRVWFNPFLFIISTLDHFRISSADPVGEPFNQSHSRDYFIFISQSQASLDWYSKSQNACSLSIGLASLILCGSHTTKVTRVTTLSPFSNLKQAWIGIPNPKMHVV
jgi:hypothetical protein